MTMIRISISLILISSFSIFAQDKPNLKIQLLRPKNLAYGLYSIVIASDNSSLLADELNDKKERKYKIEIGKDDKIQEARITENGAEKDKDNARNVVFTFSLKDNLPEGDTEIKIYSKLSTENSWNLEDTMSTKLPPLRAEPAKQPFIQSVTPEGGIRGSTISIKGKGFGDNVDDIIITMSDIEKSEGEKKYTEIREKKPFYLSPEINETQEIKLSLPFHQDVLKGRLRAPLFLQVTVDGRPSNYANFTILDDNWKLYAIGLSIGVVILLLTLIAIMNKNFWFFRDVIIDKATMTYSLSKFQAFAWTIVFMGTYFYIAISQGVLLRNGKVPDFNPSLLILMGISYGGLVTATTLGAKKPKNEIKDRPPQLANLFSEGGNIDLSRLQLFGFTIIGIMVYIYNVYTGNPLEGMPDVPSTLLGLMGVSQTGYIGPKALVDKVSVNYVTPKDIVIYQYNSTMNIIGSGFTSGTKVMIEGYDPIPAQFNSPSSLSIPLPTFVETKKSVSITILPPNGSSIIIEDAFHIVAEKPVVMPENLDDDHNSDYMTKDAPPENLGEPESQIEPVKEV